VPAGRRSRRVFVRWFAFCSIRLFIVVFIGLLGKMAMPPLPVRSSGI
jgi:hypothetical protein